MMFIGKLAFHQRNLTAGGSVSTEPLGTALGNTEVGHYDTFLDSETVTGITKFLIFMHGENIMTIFQFVIIF
jgi:hypothetical protein